jgi:signal transduction histidine kinase
MGYLELARDRGELPEPMRTYLEQVFAGINQTVTAARSFQELTEARQEIVPIYLNDELRQLSESRAQEWDRQNIKTTLVVEIVPPVLADEDEMRLVLSYLIRNAENSVLQFETKRELRLHLWCADQTVHISIHSNAPTLRPAVKPLLLEPFWHTPEESPTALGLAVANSIVQRYKGQIRSETGRGMGTTFLVILPTLKESPRRPN